jgi:hypothetical protein
MTRAKAEAEVVPVLSQSPFSAEKVDKELVERSVAHIREIIAKTVSVGQEEIGRFLLKEFFDDDPTAYVASTASKHASLRKLMERCESLDFPVSRTFLQNALRLAAVSRGLPRGATFNQLPASHRVELLRVKAPERLEKLATRAVEGRLSVKKLRVLVQKAEVRSATAPGRGRTAAPSVSKAVEGCLRLLRDEETGKLLFRKSDISGLTEEQLERARTAFKLLDKRVEDLRRLLG